MKGPRGRGTDALGYASWGLVGYVDSVADWLLSYASTMCEKKLGAKNV